jgi:PAS domain-containing protein
MTTIDNLKYDMFRSVFDAIPSFAFVVDDDVRIQDYNAAAGELLSVQRSVIIKRRGGEVLHCIHATDVLEGCGHGPFCKDCVIRNAVAEALQGKRVVRRRTRLEIIRDGDKIVIYALITASSFRYKEKRLALLVIEDISEIAELYRMIPICSVCKKVQDEKKSWSRVEAYFKEHWDLDFSHGLCPECFKNEMAKLE